MLAGKSEAGKTIEEKVTLDGFKCVKVNLQ